ncbi:pregnancy-associated plasma protein-A-domain-containing protein [Panaeolus papilionaceus]|nr:pregnancy-associated plasma protein-A-domain-containing protein [Panaeolus papilionaceus]
MHTLALLSASGVYAGSLSDRLALGSVEAEGAGGVKKYSGFCAAPYSAYESETMKEALGNARTAREKLGRRRGMQRRSGTNATEVQRRQTPARMFDLHFNVVAGNMTTEGGWVPDSMIDAQMALLNRNYRPSGIQFQHKSTTRILSNYWANELFLPDTNAREEMMLSYGELFKKGDLRTLNVNTLFLTATPADLTDQLPDGSLIFGFALPPSISSQFPLVDGVFIRHDSMPGGPFDRAQGGTLVHEVGHWLSLWHTFQGGCAGEGDEVDDTPAQRTATDGCPVGRDSCPGGAGLDPINNYMDYSDESCQEEFTAGQMERMQEAIDAYRS